MDRKLIDYYPPLLKTTRELEAITDKAEQKEFEDVWNALNTIFNSQYIQTATALGISRWERILGITPKASESLDVRKFRIISRLNESLPYTIRRLEEMLTTLCGESGYTLLLTHDDYLLEVQIAVAAKESFNDVVILLNKVIPANMIISVTQLYNQYQTLRQFTHAQLQAYNHEQLRNEVLN